jgi:UDP-glucose 4-epimerase
MTVLVTGATGLIGRHTLAHLLEQGEHVRTFQRGQPDIEHASNVETVVGDVCLDAERLCEAAGGCEAIVHLAGRGDVGESHRDPLGYANLNASGALHALEAARRAGAHVILASSQRVYRPGPGPRAEDDTPAPDSPYGYTKWVAEVWCRMASEQFGVPTSVLRFFSVYGPGQQPNGGSGVVAIFARAALAGEPLVVQSRGRRDFTHARDVARGIGLVLEARRTRPGPGLHCVYNIATGRGTTFTDLARRIVELSGSRSPIEDCARDAPGADLVADVGRARAELGFEACIDLAAGVKSYLDWLRAA